MFHPAQCAPRTTSNAFKRRRPPADPTPPAKKPNREGRQAANASGISASIKPSDHDYHIHVVEQHNTGPTTNLTLATFIALCSAAIDKPVLPQIVVLGSMSLGGSIVPVDHLAETLQLTFDAGGKRLLLPMASVGDIPSVPGELFAKFQTSFFADPADAVFKSVGAE